MRTLILVSAFFPFTLHAGNNESAAFDADFLRQSSQEIPQQFYNPDHVDAGTKSVDVVLNDRTLFKTNIEFILLKGSDNAVMLPTY